MVRLLIKHEKFICFLLLVIMLIVVFADGINVLEHAMLGFDEGYNATVANNVVKYGKYMTSYPEGTVFYNIITTGQAVVLPTAAMIKLFGVSTLSTGIIPLLYSLISIVLLFLVFVLSLNNYRFHYYVSLIMTACVILSDLFFQTISTKMIGESAAISFLLVSLLLSIWYLNGKSVWKLMLAGAFVAFAFLTKTATIFFVVTFFGIIIIESLLCRTLTVKEAILVVIGFICGIIIMDSYKVFQVGGLDGYIGWWKSEISNMFNQSSGVCVYYDMHQKFNFLLDIFGKNSYFSLIMILMPVLIYVVHIIGEIFKRHVIKAETTVISIYGVAGSSLLIFFLLLGGDGLVYARRQCINAFFIKVFMAYLCALFLLKFIDYATNKNMFNKHSVISLAISFIIFFVSFSTSMIKENAFIYLNKEIEDTYEKKLMTEFISEIQEKVDDKTIYVYGWWQEPNISLYTEKDMEPISSVEYIEDGSVFVIGRRFDGYNADAIEDEFNIELNEIDDIDVDYSQIDSFGGSNLFSIYRITNKS